MILGINVNYQTTVIVYVFSVLIFLYLASLVSSETAKLIRWDRVVGPVASVPNSVRPQRFDPLLGGVASPNFQDMFIGCPGLYRQTVEGFFATGNTGIGFIFIGNPDERVFDIYTLLTLPLCPS